MSPPPQPAIADANPITLALYCGTIYVQRTLRKTDAAAYGVTCLIELEYHVHLKLRKLLSSAWAGLRLRSTRRRDLRWLSPNTVEFRERD